MSSSSTPNTFETQAAEIKAAIRQKYRDSPNFATRSGDFTSSISSGSTISIKAKNTYFRYVPWNTIIAFLREFYSEENSKLWEIDIDAYGKKEAIMRLLKRCLGAVGYGSIIDICSPILSNHIEESKFVGLWSTVPTGVTSDQFLLKNLLKGVGSAVIFKLVMELLPRGIDYYRGHRDTFMDWTEVGKLVIDVAITAVTSALITYAASGLIMTIVLSVIAHIVLKWLEDFLARRSTWSDWWDALKSVFSGESYNCWDDANVEIPRDLCCPLSHSLFWDPVVLCDQLYERKWLVEWVQKHGTDPLTRREVSVTMIKPCPKMRALATQFADANNIPSLSS